jgi:CBS domain-containing protein
MQTIKNWLNTTRARDVMTKHVTALAPTDQLASAVSLFLSEQITGAPVVDRDGICLGVLSATDIVSFEEKRGATPNESPACPGATRRSFDSWHWGEHWWRDFGLLGEELRPRLENTVAEHMTRDIVGVDEGASLGVVMRQMLDAHVHRVLVLDGARRLQGIITTMDVISAVLRMPTTVGSQPQPTRAFARRSRPAT